jgi:hypothetical protein
MAAAVHPEDAAIEAAYPPVPYDSREWDEEDEHWTPDDATRIYSRTLELRFFDLDPTCEFPTMPAMPPISGGAEPYQPTPEDWAEYHRMMDLTDRLDEFNRLRDDASETPA